MTMTNSNGRQVHWRVNPDRSLAENAAFFAGMFRRATIRVTRSERTGKLSVLVQIAEADEWAHKEFKKMARLFGLKKASITKSDRHPRRLQAYRRLTSVFRDTDAADVQKLLSPMRPWLDVDKILAACDEILRGV